MPKRWDCDRSPSPDEARRRRSGCGAHQMSRRVHVLTQYVWPDDAPTGIYAEQIADGLAAQGVPVRLVAGSGKYRPGSRAAPRTEILRLPHRLGRRGRLMSTAREYLSVHRAFARYLRSQVGRGDTVLITSAPPTTVFLHAQVRRRGARAVYWLQDYYPQLIRGVWDPPRVFVKHLGVLWENALARWNEVIKSAPNLAYRGSNARVLRNWNTIDPGEPRPCRSGTALYSGNLGYGHDLGAFIDMCAGLRDRGYEVTVRGDGPGMSRLPDWINIEAPLEDPASLLASYWEAEVHLVAADPRLQDAIFPSKIWNSLAVGRPIMASGFAGAMAEELDYVRQCDFRRHLPEFIEWLAALHCEEWSDRP